MKERESFNEVVAKNRETLELYVPVVARVHGAHHPEIFDVQKVFQTLTSKLDESGDDADLEDQFVTLREITGEYTVPEDTCETYEAVYDMLNQWDKAYHS